MPDRDRRARGHRGRAARARAAPQARIDVLGTILLSLAAGCFVLATSLGGATYGWGSWQIIGLGVVTVVATALLIPVEKRARRAGAADEPVLEPRLHGGRRDRLHRRLRALRRDDLPAALPADRHRRLADRARASVAAVDPRAARHLDRQRPDHRALGALPARSRSRARRSWSSASGGCRRWSPRRALLERSLDMVILGLGIGLVMQVLVLAVQNDVDYRDLGVATSGATFFRSIGGCFGVAICGAIFSNRLADELSELSGLPPSVGAGRVTREHGRPAAARGAGGVRRRLLRRADHGLRRLRADRGASPSSCPGCCPRSRCGARSRRPASARRSRRPSTTTRCPRSSARSRRSRAATPACGSSSASAGRPAST